MSVQEPLMQGLIEKIAVLVLDSSGCVVERFNMQLKVSYLLTHSAASDQWLGSDDGAMVIKCGQILRRSISSSCSVIQ